jgi:hypothetical protein
MPCEPLPTPFSFRHRFLYHTLYTQLLLPTMSLRATARNATQAAIGYRFKDTNLLLKALDTTGMRTSESNQRLAMLGDALLKMVLLDSWYAGSTAKGSHATKHRRRRSAIDSSQGMATTWSPPLVAIQTWQPPQEMPALISILFYTLGILAGCLTRLLRRLSRRSWAPSTWTRLKTWKPSVV